MAKHYKLLFRGAVHSDQHPAVVRPRLQALLKASDAQMDAMFSGQPVTIKKAVKEAVAERYLDAFIKAGAKLELVQVAAPPQDAPRPPVDSASSAEASPSVAASESALQLAEVGAFLVPEALQRSEPVVQIATDHLTLASPGALLGGTGAIHTPPAPPIDTSHLHLDEAGVRLGMPTAEFSIAAQLIDFDFQLGEVGEVLVESVPGIEPELPDLSHLQLEPEQ